MPLGRPGTSFGPNRTWVHLSLKTGHYICFKTVVQLIQRHEAPTVAVKNDTLLFWLFAKPTHCTCQMSVMSCDIVEVACE